MGVAEDEVSFRKMRRTHMKVCDVSWFYAGYSELGGEDDWRQVKTGEPLAWNNWLEGEPNNWGGKEDCLGSTTHIGGFFDIKCQAKTCPICKGRCLKRMIFQPNSDK